MDRDESQRGTDAAAEHTADWESVALDRVRGRVERADASGADMGWEAAALARLRAHFGAEG